MSNEIIGTWQCGGGGTADVMQTKRRGKHLYTNCACCGLNQGTGAAFQTRLWNESTFKPGATVIKPSNVTDDKPGQSVKSEPEPVGGAVTESESPNDDEEYSPQAIDEKETETETGGGGSAFGLLAGLVLVGSGIGGYLWTRKPKL